jgi:hypothetical protein
MRIAIQVSGELRTVRQWMERLPKVLQMDTVDIHVHTWRREETSDAIASHGVGLHVLQPRSYIVEPYEDRVDLHALPRGYTMWYSVGRANTTRKNYERLTETNYDLVIRWRTDCFVEESLVQILEALSALKTSFLWIPTAKRGTHADGPIQEEDDDSLCDWFAVGTPDAMDVYCGTYETWRPTELPLVAESMVALQLKSRGITRQTILHRDPLDLYLVDGDGTPR